MKTKAQETIATNSWLDPTSPGSALAVQFDRERQSLRLVRKGAAKWRAYTIAFFFMLGAVIAGTMLFLPSMDARVGAAYMLACFSLLVMIQHYQQVEIDTKGVMLVSRARGIIIPWTWIASTPIGNTACFEVRDSASGPHRHILYFVPSYPDAWLTSWRPVPIGTTYDSDAGKPALERLAFGLNRFLDAVRNGEPNLERLAQPAPPGPFKP